MAAQQSFTSVDPSKVVNLAISKEGFASEQPCTVGKLLKEAVSKFAAQLALRFKEGNTWKEFTYRQYYSYCVKVAKAFVKVITIEPYWDYK